MISSLSQFLNWASLSFYHRLCSLTCDLIRGYHRPSCITDSRGASAVQQIDASACVEHSRYLGTRLEFESPGPIILMEGSVSTLVVGNTRSN